LLPPPPPPPPPPFFWFGRAAGDNKPAENAKSSESAESSSIATETATKSTPEPLKDVNNFDISGVKLGMTWDEARTAIKEDLNITDNEIKVSGFTTKLLVSGKEVPNAFSVKKTTIRSK